jgi:hypothetical protein
LVPDAERVAVVGDAARSCLGERSEMHIHWVQVIAYLVANVVAAAVTYTAVPRRRRYRGHHWAPDIYARGDQPRFTRVLRTERVRAAFPNIPVASQLWLVSL